MKKFLKDWKWQEIVLLSISVLIITTVFIFSKDKNVISFIVSILGIISVMMCSKGLFYAPILDFVYYVLYIIMSFQQRYYGEIFVYVFIMIPLTISTLSVWVKNKNKENNTVKVNRISKKEWLFLFISCLVIPFIFYFILKLLNTSQLIISTLSIVTSIFASYLLLRRSSFYALGYILNDIVLIILWSLTFAGGNLSNLPLVISLFVYLINDFYGLFRWKKQEKEQNKESKEIKEELTLN